MRVFRSLTLACAGARSELDLPLCDKVLQRHRPRALGVINALTVILRRSRRLANRPPAVTVVLPFHPAGGQQALEKLLLARPLSQPQRHRVHVRSSQRLPPHHNSLRQVGRQLPRLRCMPSGNCQLLVMSSILVSQRPDQANLGRDAARSIGTRLRAPRTMTAFLHDHRRHGWTAD